MTSASIADCVEQAILGGATLVQLREKDAGSLEFYETALKVREITARHGIPLIINDRADIALAVDADGVHVGQGDLPCAIVRQLLGDDKIIGVSVGSVEEAALAVRDGANYLGVGAMFATGTKSDAMATDMSELRRICTQADVPVVAIGGINKHNIPQLTNSGIAGVAVVSAIVAQPCPQSVARELKALVTEVLA